MYINHSNVQLPFLSLCRSQNMAMPSRLTVVLLSLLLATPVIIFWLWLLILPTSVAVLCPEKCRCDLEGYFVNCSRSGLNSIPSVGTSTYFTTSSSAPLSAHQSNAFSHTRYLFLHSAISVSQPTNQPTKGLTEGVHLRVAQVDYPRIV